MINTIPLLIAFSLLVCFSRSFSQDKPAAGEQKKTEMSTEGIKELDAFHEMLHPLVHESYPNKDFAAIKTALHRLIESATALRGAKLPKSLSAKTKAYRSVAKKLVTQLKNLNKRKSSLSDEEFGKKFMEMHDTFEKLMGMTE